MKWVLRGAVLIIAVFLVVGGSGYLYLRGSLPQLDGSISVKGISGPVEITRDKSGIPHIEADSLEDAVFALGFVHAQDRLWQMETNRRIGAGRLSEIMGEATLGTDKFLRTLGVYRSAKNTFNALDTETKQQMQAYADGVNAFLKQRSGPLPPEFLILGVSPEPWTPVDSVVWTKMMSWDLSKNWSRELERMQLLSIMSPEQVMEILPPYQGEKTVPLPDYKDVFETASLDIKTLVAMAPEPLPEGAGSNNWVVSGAKTETGKPLLANDPHLGLAAPALWYFAHIKTPDLSAIGATLPGVPSIILGRNETIAWGFTNTGPDVQDLFIEKINPDNPKQYKTPKGWADFEIREETIKIKDQEPVTFSVRSTRHGPVISDAHKRANSAIPENHVLAFAWTTLLAEDKTPEAAAKMMRAENWEDFKEAIRAFTSPEQNMLYGDVNGNIGYYAPGLVPIRTTENLSMGRLPVPGWIESNDWIGFIPFEDLPHLYNPPSGMYHTANEKIVPDNYPYFITADWALPYRSARIKELLSQEEEHSVQTFMGLQSDVTSLMAIEFLEILLTTNALDNLSRDALIGLSTWDGRMTREDNRPLIFNAWMRALSRAIYADELGDLFSPYWKIRPIFLKRVLLNKGGMEYWCDVKATEKTENCDEILQQSLQTALADLAQRYGSDMDNWTWGEAHFAHSDHLPFSRVTGLRNLFDIKVPSMGDSFTVNVGRNRLTDDNQPFANTHAASLRAIYDFSDLNNSRYIHSTGQSGNILSPFYDDMAEDWSNMKYLKMTTSKADYSQNAIGVLTLVPN
ncbi:MAG: penicillin acylase family protein [Sneathiella sp.]|nr:penicillin acylase family protein [Sneathiella sp.]